MKGKCGNLAARLVLMVALAHLVACAANPRTEETEPAPPRAELVVPAEAPVVAHVPAQSPSSHGSSYGSSYDNEIKLVETLLTKSSAAKRVREGGDAAALAELKKAEHLFQAAKEGKESKALALLSQAKQALFTAMRHAAKPAPRDGASHASLQKTTRVMLDAYQRILQEKSLRDTGNVAAEVRAQLDLSESYSEREDSILAEQTAAAAFHRVREAIVGLRSGDTLIRSLHFESPADEYRYEVDRNQTHELLVKLLVQKQSLSSAELENIQRLLVTARLLRKQATAQAEEGNYSSAINALEESTQYIIRAIRAAGIYIPS
jgi:hypothetical protein